MDSRQAFEKVGGFDEDLRESLFDIDLCLKLREKQYRMVCIPFPLLYNSSDQLKCDTFHKNDAECFKKKWSDVIRGVDPYYNVNLMALKENFILKM